MIERCSRCDAPLGWMYWTKNGKKYCDLTCETVDSWDWSQYGEEQEEESC